LETPCQTRQAAVGIFSQYEIGEGERSEVRTGAGGVIPHNRLTTWCSSIKGEKSEFDEGIS
jgi:hypothetical protein